MGPHKQRERLTEMITSDQAETIIALLESINDNLRKKNARAEKIEANRISNDETVPFIEAIQANMDKLKGRRLLAHEIADAIGMDYDPKVTSQRLGMGHALTHVGALKGKSGSTRYYVFK